MYVRLQRDVDFNNFFLVFSFNDYYSRVKSDGYSNNAYLASRFGRPIGHIHLYNEIRVYTNDENKKKYAVGFFFVTNRSR